MSTFRATDRAQPRILFVTRKWAPATGGMETYCLRLTEHLAAIEPVDIVALKGKANGMPPSIIALAAFPFMVFSRYLRRRTSPAVLHLGDMAIWPLALPFLWRNSTRIVLSAHGTDVAYHRRGGVRGTFYGAYLRFGARLLSRATVIANSHATRQVTEETGWKTIQVVKLGTDFPCAGSKVENSRSLLFAGRLVKRKGFGWFVREVLPLLPADIAVNAAGSGWDEDEAAALDDPRVTYLGDLSQHDLAAAYRQALCVIVPNIELPNGEYEGFGLVAVEAASAGGIVLAANHGGLRDAVLDGETGFLVETGNSQAWAAKIAEIADWDDDRRQAFTQGSMANVNQHYSWQRVAQETLAAYRLR